MNINKINVKAFDVELQTNDQSLAELIVRPKISLMNKIKYDLRNINH